MKNISVYFYICVKSDVQMFIYIRIYHFISADSDSRAPMGQPPIDLGWSPPPPGLQKPIFTHFRAKRFGIDFASIQRCTEKGVAVRPLRLLDALGAHKSKKQKKWAHKATFWELKTVKTQHVHNLHRNANYTINPLICCFIWSSIKQMFVVFVS